MKAKDMAREVICVRPGTTVEPRTRLLTAHRIGGIPTVTSLPVVQPATVRRAARKRK